MSSGENPSSQPLGVQPPPRPLRVCDEKLCEHKGNDAWVSDGEEMELSGMLISLMQLSFPQPAECSGCLLTAGRRNTKSLCGAQRRYLSQLLGQSS